jgi:hypothetical protein
MNSLWCQSPYEMCLCSVASLSLAGPEYTFYTLCILLRIYTYVFQRNCYLQGANINDVKIYSNEIDLQ